MNTAPAFITRCILGIGALLPLCLHAQSAPRNIERFTLTWCPMNTGVDKAEFNKRYGTVGSEALFVQALRRSFSGDHCCHVEFTVKPLNAPPEFYVYHIPTARSRPAALASLSSKSDLSSMVQSKRELGDLFRDTVAVWDTLRIRVRLLDADLAQDGYHLLWTDTITGKTFSSAVPHRGDTLFISQPLFGPSPAAFTALRLRHRALRGQDLARGTLRFLAPVERSSMMDLVCSVAAQHPDYTQAQYAQLLHQFCTDWYGHTPADQLPEPHCLSSKRP